MADTPADPVNPLSADALREAEELFLAVERNDPASPYYLGDEPPANDRVPSRRRFMLAALGAAAAAPGIAYAKSVGSIDRDVPTDPTKVQGVGVKDDDGGYGSRSQFETEVRDRYATKTTQSSWSFTPLQNSMGIITPSGLHYERHHGGTATIDPAEHELFVHGMVNQAKKFNMAALRRYPALSRLMFLECSGNGLTEWAEPKLKTVQGTHGLTSTSEWVGVPLSTILNEVGVKPGAKWLLCEGGDAAVMTRSIPLEKAMRDCLLAYGQNGEAIRPEQGYPLRLFDQVAPAHRSGRRPLHDAGGDVQVHRPPA
jgi:sulfane dehydrogenase subunit SoxC